MDNRFLRFLIFGLLVNSVFGLNANIIFSDTTFVLKKSEIVPDLSPKVASGNKTFNFADLDAQLQDPVNKSSNQYAAPPPARLRFHLRRTVAMAAP